MKLPLPALVVIVSLLIPPATAQDFKKGLAAAERGEFAVALREWRPLAEQGEAGAQFNIGLIYKNGKGIPPDYTEAAMWYRLAAKQGHSELWPEVGDGVKG